MQEVWGWVELLDRQRRGETHAKAGELKEKGVGVGTKGVEQSCKQVVKTMSCVFFFFFFNCEGLAKALQ